MDESVYVCVCVLAVTGIVLLLSLLMWWWCPCAWIGLKTAHSYITTSHGQSVRYTIWVRITNLYAINWSPLSARTPLICFAPSSPLSLSLSFCASERDPIIVIVWQFLSSYFNVIRAYQYYMFNTIILPTSYSARNENDMDTRHGTVQVQCRHTHTRTPQNCRYTNSQNFNGNSFFIFHLRTRMVTVE